MTKKKTKTSHDDTSSYSGTSTSSVGETPDIAAYRGWQPQLDPTIPYRYANAKTKLNESFNNPMGQFTTPAIREATQRAGEGELMQQEGQAMREGQYDVNAQTGNKLGYLAGLTAPRTTTSSGTGASSGTGTSTYSPSLMDSIQQGVDIGKTATGGKFLPHG